MTDRLFDPARTAFISIDMQNGVASHDSVPNSAADVIARVSEMVDATRAGGGLVVYVRTSFLPDESDALHPKMDVVRPAKPVRPAGWDELVPAMQPLPTEPVIIKRSFDAFFGSDLDLQLRRHGIDTIVIAGISTNFGVEGTARTAYNSGYDVVFAEDAMGTSSLAMHEGSLANVFPYIGRVRTVAEIVEAFTATEAAA
jgi:nicotinamidase-related amidase